MKNGLLAIAISAIVGLNSPCLARDMHSPLDYPIAKQSLSYAQLLTEHLQFQNFGTTGVAFYVLPVSGTGRPTLMAQTGVPAIAATDPRVLRAAAQNAAAWGSDDTAVVPLRDVTGRTIGALAIAFAQDPQPSGNSRLEQALAIRDYVQLIIPKRQTLDDPYSKGYDAGDTLVQRINQILLDRHPDAAVIAIHLTAPGDTKNKVWGINRPDFIGRPSDETDTDTEKTGRIMMELFPESHRMEVHMPLLTPKGELIGTLCTVYFWKTAGEAADYYGRSLSMMNEARLLTPADRAALFRP